MCRNEERPFYAHSINLRQQDRVTVCAPATGANVLAMATADPVVAPAGLDPVTAAERAYQCCRRRRT